MKIVCIGRNYAEHVQELGNAMPAEPVFFLKPLTAILPLGESFRIPSWAQRIDHEIELVFRVSRECRDLRPNTGDGHLDGVTIGLDLTARDVQDELKKNGLPWEKAKAFDHSAVLGTGFQPIPDDPAKLEFQLFRNGTMVQQGNAKHMIFDPVALLCHVSRYITLMPGDLLFTGTPAGVGPLSSGDHVVGRLNGMKLLEIEVE